VSGWGCPHNHNDRCNLLQTVCEPGMKGCVLYGQFTFSNPLSPSNEAFTRRQEREKKQSKLPDEEENPSLGD
jgi:hypothetical protein